MALIIASNPTHNRGCHHSNLGYIGISNTTATTARTTATTSIKIKCPQPKARPVRALIHSRILSG